MEALTTKIGSLTGASSEMLGMVGGLIVLFLLGFSGVLYLIDAMLRKRERQERSRARQEQEQREREMLQPTMPAALLPSFQERRRD